MSDRSRDSRSLRLQWLHQRDDVDHNQFDNNYNNDNFQFDNHNYNDDHNDHNVINYYYNHYNVNDVVDDRLVQSWELRL